MASNLDFMTALRLCRAARLIFARPLSWHGSARALDLGSKLGASPNITIVSPASEGNFFYEAWNPSPEDFGERWVMVSSSYLHTELKLITNETPKEKYGLELAD